MGGYFMKVWGRKLGGILGAGLLLTCGNAMAEEVKGKIYLGDEGWTTAEQGNTEAPQASLLDSLFGRASTAPLDFRKMARDFIEQNARLLKVDNATSWGQDQVQNSPALQTHRLSKTWNGLPVLGGDAVVAISGGSVAFANADATDLSSLTTKPRVRAEDARSMAFASYRGNAVSTSAPRLKVIILGDGSEKKAELAYEVTVNDRDQLSSDIHYVSATTGRELMVSTNVHTLVNRQVVAGLGSEDDWNIVQADDQADWKIVHADKGCNGERPIGNTRPTGAPTSCFTPSPSVAASALAAWNNSGLVAEYYQSVHNRNSIDNNGMLIKSVVNFVGSAFANAAWFNDKSMMLYGVGDPATQNDFALPLDVAAHEMTHGITARTAALEYVSESGALNESYSDVFGKLVAFKYGKSKDWKIGGELFKDGVTFVRDMENPKIGHTKDFLYKGQTCHRFNDFCGVHQNSGIPNKAAVLLAKRIGNEKLGKLYFLTLTQLLRKNSNFKEARAQTEAACGTLFGATSADCKAVKESFDAVGI